MRRIGDLLKDLGFNPDAPMETQKALFKHLAKAADQSKVPASFSSRAPSGTPGKKEAGTFEQLSFDPDILGVFPLDPKSKNGF